MRLRGRLIAVLAVLLTLPAAALAAFPQDPPDDPVYDRAEEDPAQFCVDDEQIEAFSFLPRCAPGASDPEGASGMSIDRAWREFTTGSDEILIAYVEAGVNWRDENARDLADQVYLNARELPPPTTPDAETGALRARDYADTRDANGNGFVDPEDLIVRFSDGRDDDGNGYVDDISGWDTYNDQNDPATFDSAYEHANNQMERASAEADNGFNRAGICPKCRILPVKGGAEALDRTDDLGEAWLFALDSGAQVINSETADLGYSTFTRRIAERIQRQGAVLVAASNDFNSTDHQGGMFHEHALPGNGIVADRLGTEALTRTTRTYRERSSISSWGPHNMFSVTTTSGTTSANTPTVSGVVALVLSYGVKIGRPLTGAQAVQVLRATASDIDDRSLAWPNGPGFDLQFGYGRPNVYKAMQAIAAGDVPPVAVIDSPDWYELHDPTTEQEVGISGRAEAAWTVEMGLGAEPKEWKEIGSGGGGDVAATLRLSDVPRDFWAKPMAISQRKELETSEHYTVTLRLRAKDAAGRVGEDRRTIAVHHDEDWVLGFPRRIGPGGDGQPALVDLQSRGRLAVVFGDTDGRVHAVDPRRGRELRGWPVQTDAVHFTKAPPAPIEAHEPIPMNVAVADLDGDGRLSVVATTTNGRVYAWSPRGKRRKGFPVTLATGVEPPPIPRPDLPFTRLPKQGAFAAPVIGDLDADGRMEIVQAAWDGRLHVLDRRGREKAGWPVEVKLPDGYEPSAGQKLVNDHKLQSSPALADLDGDRRLEIVQRSQYTDIIQPDISPAAKGHLHAYRADGTPVPGWPVTMDAIAEAYGTAQEFITEGSNAPVAADLDGDGDDEVVSNPVFTQPIAFDGDGRKIRDYGPGSDALAALQRPGGAARAVAGDLPADVPVGFTTSGAFGRFGGRLAYAQPGSGTAGIAATTLFPGLGTTITNYERAFDARTGDQLSGFPTKTQGLNFLGSPLFADVTGDGEAEIVDGGDTNVLHAFGADGRMVEGFPKFHTGWTLWSPAAGDLDGDGYLELVTATREGYLMAWHTKGRSAANREWWRWHHDERSTGNYGIDARPPSPIHDLRIRVRRDRRAWAIFTLPGDDWLEGSAHRVRFRLVRKRPRGRWRTVPPNVKGGELVRLFLGRNVRKVRVQAIDDAGNRTRLVTKRVPRASGRARRRRR